MLKGSDCSSASLSLIIGFSWGSEFPKFFFSGELISNPIYYLNIPVWIRSSVAVTGLFYSKANHG